MERVYVLTRHTNPQLQIGVYFWHKDTDRDQMPPQVAAPIHEAPTSLDGDHMEKWGKPQAYFGYNDGSNIQGDFENKFGLHEIIFDTTYVFVLHWVCVD